MPAAIRKIHPSLHVIHATSLAGFSETTEPFHLTLMESETLHEDMGAVPFNPDSGKSHF